MLLGRWVRWPLFTLKPIRFGIPRIDIEQLILHSMAFASWQISPLYTLNNKLYWGGMLRQGATSFWEKYVPSETGTQHLAMYGRPYGKSLCHAWGASPVYLLGKYYLGVRPTKPGYAEFEIRPSLGDLDWLKGDVPTPHGMIHVEMNRHEVKVLATEGSGTLFIAGQQIPVKSGTDVCISY